MPTNLNNRTHILFNTPPVTTFLSHGWMLMTLAAYTALRQTIGTAPLTYTAFYNFVDMQYANRTTTSYTFNNGHLVYLGHTFQARRSHSNYQDLFCELLAPSWGQAQMPAHTHGDPRYYEYRLRSPRQRRRRVGLFSNETQLMVFVSPPPARARSQS